MDIISRHCLIKKPKRTFGLEMFISQCLCKTSNTLPPVTSWRPALVAGHNIQCQCETCESESAPERIPGCWPSAGSQPRSWCQATSSRVGQRHWAWVYDTSEPKWYSWPAGSLLKAGAGAGLCHPVSVRDMGIGICAGTNTWALAKRQFPAEALVPGHIIQCQAMTLSLSFGYQRAQVVLVTSRFSSEDRRWCRVCAIPYPSETKNQSLHRSYLQGRETVNGHRPKVSGAGG